MSLANCDLFFAKWLLRTKELVVERAEIVWKALRIFQTANVDFADCLIESLGGGGGMRRNDDF